ncbi:ACL059Cp [Eremothecium gossypii ATCC 10895]|uniref:Cystathionine beta-lyase n=1 Tax=Eremothecium gossypii (strain ATCC 10895 / CBS 109.51 / FGSC 9923 / NRRL Y-1056) TaxID=284811 RepID=Q75CH8_EREGS|nr:ACL059Cp [Eremothecium gossypii ATCC 10895]AAS51169.1 ACL059Cp [Eremothecium gossypii ATCC 10895]AEY95460.1 FACL059Cp [Eremothecium gossypii FDAG1]
MRGGSQESRLVCVGEHGDQHGASVPALYQSTTFKQRTLDGQAYDYTRSGNPTRTVAEGQVGRLYGVGPEQVMAVASGMTALDVVLRAVLRRGGRGTVIAGDDLYGGTQRLLGLLAETGQARVVHVDTADTAAFCAAVAAAGEVACVLLESPTNPLMKVADVPALVAHVKAHAPGCRVVVDNTMMSGLNCNPLRLGADYVYESATKYLNGHHDIMAGVIVAATRALAEEAYFVVNSVGAGLAPMDAWLLIRGLKTLSLRLYKQQHNAMVLAHWLREVCGFRAVGGNHALQTRFVGLRSHPQHKLHRSFNRGPGAVLSIQTGDTALSERIVCSKKLQFWGVTVSFGCVNSLISMPCRMSHASIDPELRKARQFPEDLIRLSCGVEDVEDLQQDLLAALEDAGAVVVRDGGRTIVNRLNGHIGTHVSSSEQRCIYRDFFGDSSNPSLEVGSLVAKL